MGAMCRKIPFPLGVLEVEARVVEEGIIFAKDLGLGEVIVEGDASIVMSALSKPDHTPSSIQKIMKGVRTWFSADLLVGMLVMFLLV